MQSLRAAADMADLTSDEAKAAHGSENARNRDLDSQLGGREQAQRVECERLLRDLEQLKTIQADDITKPTLTPDERAGMPAAIATTEERIGKDCR
jgi:hypothetical protein